MIDITDTVTRTSKLRVMPAILVRKRIVFDMLDVPVWLFDLTVAGLQDRLLQIEAVAGADNLSTLSSVDYDKLEASHE